MNQPHTTSQPTPDEATLNAAAQAAWNTNAAFWDEQMGDGNQFQLHLVGPTSERLLAVQPGERVLEVACGNGVFARRLASLGADMVACDFSAEMIARARAHAFADRIAYSVIDATNEAQLLTLGEQGFDAAVCNMAFMDMVTLDPLFSALRHLLKPNGRFVFSWAHPCFNASEVRHVIEEEDREGELVTTYALKIAHYIQPTVTRGLGIIGQPEPHYYFHRPLSEALRPAFNAGFTLDALEEPTFTSDAIPSRPFAWANYAPIPPVIVCRARPPR